MSDRFFLDTNIFVCFDRSNPQKQQTADSLVRRALTDQSGLISTQVIQEFLNMATRKFFQPMSNLEARAYLGSVLVPLCKVFPTSDLYAQSLDLHAETGFSFYDCLIIAAGGRLPLALFRRPAHRPKSARS